MKLFCTNQVVMLWEPFGAERRVRAIPAALSTIVFAVLLFSSQAAGQPDPLDLPPPPSRAISKDETTRLESESDVKSRTLVAIELMNHRIAAAEKKAAGEDFEGMVSEFGVFQGLLDNTLEFLVRSDNDSNRVLNNFKRLEIGIRGLVPRIEIVRRELPSRYEPYVKGLIKYVREARGKALEPLFGDSVVREPRRP